MPSIPISSIFVKKRLRFETYGDIPELADDLAAEGQIQSIAVRAPREDEDLPEGKRWILTDGGRRYAASKLLESRDIAIPGQEIGFIRADIDEREHDDLSALILEFHANEYREDFSWKEKARFYSSAHEILLAKAKENDVAHWTYKQTAQTLGVTHKTLFTYLELTQDEEILSSEEVAEAKTFREAHKKTKIAKEKKRRKKQAALKKKREAAQGIDQSDFYAQAARICTQGKCEDWIATKPDSHFAWFHWDPPYGGEQDGGAFSSHEQIDDSEEYAKDLMTKMIPEIHRTLMPGGWLVIWFHQSHREWVRSQLEAAGFWVNPYECIWHKVNRAADGHEILEVPLPLIALDCVSVSSGAFRTRGVASTGDRSGVVTGVRCDRVARSLTRRWRWGRALGQALGRGRVA